MIGSQRTTTRPPLPAAPPGETTGPEQYLFTPGPCLPLAVVLYALGVLVRDADHHSTLAG